MRSQLAQARINAVQRMYSDIAPGGRVLDEWTIPTVAARIRELAPLSRSPKWAQAVKDWAELVEEDPMDSLQWSYLQGSVFFASATS